MAEAIAPKEQEHKFCKPNDRFWQLCSAVTKRRISPATFQEPIMAIDPGETTGVCIWLPGSGHMELFQLETKSIGQAYVDLKHIAVEHGVQSIRCEDYRVYGHMTEQHAFAHLHTPQLIGAIKVLGCQHDWPTTFCLAMHAKTFWTDTKLKMCNIYIPGQRHARDAQRHLCRFMCE